MSGFSNTKARKIYDVFEDSLLNKSWFLAHTIMSLLCLIFVILEISGLIVMISSQKFTLIGFLIRTQYLIIFLSNLALNIDRIYHQKRMYACLKNLLETLGCSSRVEEAIIWHKNLKEFEFFSLGYTGTMFLAAVLTTFISPGVRFKFMKRTTFVVFPTWYPVDVFTSQEWFWIAYVCETLMMWYCAFMYCAFTVPFVYAQLTTKVRINVLGEYLKEAAKPVAQVQPKGEAGPSYRKDSLTIWSATPTVKIGMGFTLDELKACIKDLHILRRQMRLVNEAFAIYVTVAHSVSMVSNSLTMFAATYELRNSRKVTVNVIMFCSYFSASLSSSFIMCYLASLFQEAYGNLTYSLREWKWVAEKREFKKLVLLSEMVLHQSSKLKAYTFYPINLHTFTSALSRSWSVFIFLYQVSAKK